MITIASVGVAGTLPKARLVSTGLASRGKWCCQTGLNCRPLHYQWSALPLSYGSMPGIWGIGPNGRPLGGRFLPQGPRWRKHVGRPGRAQITKNRRCRSCAGQFGNFGPGPGSRFRSGCRILSFAPPRSRPDGLGRMIAVWMGKTRSSFGDGPRGVA